MDIESLKELYGISPLTIVSTLLVLFLGVLYFLLKDRGIPPGPKGLPYLGIWPFLPEDNIHYKFADFIKKYGRVYSFTVTGRLFIHLGTLKSIKEALLTKGDCFLDRYSDYSVLGMLFDKGVAITNGEKWKVLRKFFIQAFREYGITTVKDYMAGPIYDSINAAVDSLKATKGSTFNIISLLNDHCSDISRRMMFNESEATEEELKGMIDAYQHTQNLFATKAILLVGQFARYFLFPYQHGYKFALENLKKMKVYLVKIIRRHEKTFDKNNIRDLIDSYIKERNDRKEKGDPSANFFSEEALVSSMVQIVGDGTFSVAVFLGYFIRALLEYPEEQDKIYKELEDVIGPDRKVTIEDRSKLPYTNAFILEVLRATDFFTIFPSRICTKETTVNGYKIPKGSIILMNFWSAHRDPNTFDEPDKFMPSRYVSEPGKPKLETSLLFGAGKRSCIGESFAMMQIFLFLTSIVKNFRLEGKKGDTKHIFEDGIMEVCAHPRKN